MLKIIADDLGLHKSVNDGIIFLLKSGKIDGAALMANGEAFEDAVSQCLGVQFLNIGVHLVLVEEKSISGLRPSKNHKIFFIKYILGLIKLSDVEKELKAQLNKIINAGIKPRFINSHQHLHLLPGILDIVIELAKKYQIPYIRIINQPFSFFDGKLFRKAQLLFLNFLSKMAKRKIKKTGLRSNDIFIGFLNAGRLQRNDIDLADKLATQDQIVELGCHPGYENEELKIKYSHWGNYNWQKELGLLEQNR